MECNDALFTSREPVAVDVSIDDRKVAAGADHVVERWAVFAVAGTSLCRRVVRSVRDEESARKVFSEPVYLHAAAIENDDRSIVIALLAQVTPAEDGNVFLPSYPGVHAISTTPARFYPLGDIVIETHERRFPDDFLEEVRVTLGELIPVSFTSDAERQIDALLRSLD